ncbi:hypothetical protein WK43_17010 [Burkholderia ubonensis]|uniref:Uncharacterized protein n=1 Tax=Burkholderia ubonensis TaxID=101571 RepID=A0A107GG03_9BURK|nr:hypothetical protein [Burkholderia ubonensis]KVS39793.1 hypothetical protein WK37_25145 [Burkholderia ubonensis]KVS55563.1 hypothetical protein WK38_04420 [Burkholderia ubonensis]KVS73229.1 hypothetical protein WK42_04255 [Burkholderia ubonensis]KVS85289.1 hypothetical protein WK44_23140 [Burkholderia ubonensis]KVS87077.1 hypothetical protein WK45_31780 [Burkholderia ubonensis]
MTNPVGITAGCPQRFALRASAVLYVVLAVFIAAAAVAVRLFVAPRAGVAAGAGALAVTAALLAFGAARACARRLPAVVQVDALGEVAAFGRAGQLLARGRVTGYAHWSSLLLVLSVGQGGRRARPLLIPADALDAPSFSALSVLARTATAARPA